MASTKYLYSVFAIIFITGRVVDFPTTSLIFALAAIIVAINYKKLIIIFKTLPRDVWALTRMLKALRGMKHCKTNNLTLIDHFKGNADKYPNKVCIYFEEQKWTFSQLETYSNQVAHVFQSHGFRKGDVVALIMGNCVEYVAIWLGLTKIGVITALVNTNVRGQSLVHSLRVAKAKGIIYSEEFRPVVDEISADVAELARFPADENSVKEQIARASRLEPIPLEEISIKDHVFYIYTSGTTGLPKAAIIPHHRVMMVALAGYHLLDMSPADIIYNPLPLYHTAGGVLGIAGPLCFGYSVVIRKKFSASQFWTDCIKYNCTLAQYIGEMCRYILMVPSRPEDTQHKVRFIFGNGMRASLWKQFVERFNLERICELYGSTEGNTNIVNIDKTIGAVGFIPQLVPSALMPLQIIRVTELGEPIRDKRGFCQRCKPGEPGMMIGMIDKSDISREFNGYVGNKTETSKKIIEHVFRKGDKAFLSGDILVMDELGYLFFKDRTGDTFRWKGENVSTTEVEGIINSVAGLRDVTVYGVEVAENEGRAGMATIVDSTGELDMNALAQAMQTRLPSYARPIFVRVPTQMDNMTGTFKLKKMDLQKEGFDPNVVKDKLYFLDGSKGYVELTKQVYQEIISGARRL